MWSSSKYLFIFVFPLMLVSCGPLVFRAAENSDVRLRVLSVLPVVSDVEVTRERKESLRDTFERQLVGRGFTLTSPQKVDQICRQMNCADPLAVQKVAEKLRSDALVLITINNTRETNIFLAHYNAFAGKATLLGNDGKTIASVALTQSERGGLLFNSGQLIEGVKSAVDELEVSPYARLSERFTERVIEKLPPPHGAISEQEQRIMIKHTSVQPLGEARFMICVEGTPEVEAFLQFGRKQVALRPIQPGTYCNAVLLDAVITDGIAMLRSASGTSATSPIKVSSPMTCGVNESVAFEPKNIFKLTPMCSATRVLLYESQSVSGPFKFVSTLPSNKSYQTPIVAPAYAVVTFSREGGASLPHIIDNQ